MKIDPNDSRLTAYALGELDDAERAEVEALLRDDEAARREVEMIRHAATTLSGELQSEPCPRLNPEQVGALNERFASHNGGAQGFPWWRGLGWATALGAAAAIVAMTMLPALNRAHEKPRSSASQQVKLEPQPSETRVSHDSMSYANPSPQAEHPLQLSQPTAAPEGDFLRSRSLTVSPPTKPAGIMEWQNNPTYAHNGPPAASTPAAVAGSGLAMNYRQVNTLPQSGSEIGTVFRSKRAERLSSYDDQNDYSGRIDWSTDRQRPENLTVYRADRPYSVPFNEFNTESYSHSAENSFVSVTQNPLSTFGLDVDTASYANVRRFLNQGSLPPRDAVRIEEMLNYFPYDYPAPRRNEPFALYVEMSECPWNTAHRLALIGLKAKDVPPRKVQPMNLVFLIDVSGSMADANKLPLVKQALRLLVEQLTARDRVAIVVYAGDSRVALRSTRGDDKAAILEVIDSLEAGGSTNGGAGIQSAYREATANFIEGGVNRVILCTDGDFNVGVTDQNELVRLIQQQAKSRVFLTILGVGMGNLKDSTMQKLADKGNGNYAYIDDLDEARKVLVEQMRGTLVTVAKDAKVQIEFNPALVDSYRLIGYEKRMLRARDFNNDRKDAGEVGAGHTVTALYEIVPAAVPAAAGVDPLKYQPMPRAATSGELMTVKLRYKEPDASTSQLLTASVRDTGTSWRGTSSDFRFAASVAAFGLVLRDSPYKGDANLNLVRQLAENARGRDDNGYRSEFISLVDQARSLSGNAAPDDP